METSKQTFVEKSFGWFEKLIYLIIGLLLVITIGILVYNALLVSVKHSKVRILFMEF